MRGHLQLHDDLLLAASRPPAGVYTGTPVDDLQRHRHSNVFSYLPIADPIRSPRTDCSPRATYVGIPPAHPQPERASRLTVSDGASLRNATLSN